MNASSDDGAKITDLEINSGSDINEITNQVPQSFVERMKQTLSNLREMVAQKNMPV